METVAAIEQLRARLDQARAAGAVVGLVPTMGYLHDGHLSLVTRSAGECDLTVTTLFVNPLQFAEGEDLARYPREPERDAELTAGAGSDILFAPTLTEMYPRATERTTNVLTSVNVARLSEGLEGGARPTHFGGVATVVTKLFAVAGRCRAYFGEKDFQQLLVVTRLAEDLSLPVTVVGCPVVREADGLAMSSRNAYLSEAEREAAPVLHRALSAGQAAIAAGERDRRPVEAMMAAIVDAEPLVELDYAVVRSAVDLSEPAGPLGGELRLLAAARVGATRLLDNVGVTLA